jgi:hypothetical protein
MTTAPLSLLRGPLLMATVVAALTLPYILELSPRTLACVALFATGLSITLADTIALAETTLKTKTCSFLNNIVLNDVLKSWFDPETGWVACWTAFFVGNATMYTLPMTDDQRIRLVQSSLGIRDVQEAKNILTSPGGFQVMLPENIQQWLHGNETTKDEEDGNEKDCDQSNQTQETEQSSETEMRNATHGDNDQYSDEQVPFKLDSKRDAPASRGVKTRAGKNNALPPPSIVHNSSPPCTHPPQYPLDVMGSILKEMASDFIKRTCSSMSDSTIQRLAVTASVAFCMQMYKSPRSRRIVTGAIEGSAAFTFASVAVGAITALVTKAHFSECPTSPSAGGQPSSLITRVRAKLRQAAGVRRLQGIVAVLVLWYVGRRRHRGLLQQGAHQSQWSPGGST